MNHFTMYPCTSCILVYHVYESFYSPISLTDSSVWTENALRIFPPSNSYYFLWIIFPNPVPRVDNHNFKNYKTLNFMDFSVNIQMIHQDSTDLSPFFKKFNIFLPYYLRISDSQFYGSFVFKMENCDRKKKINFS